MKTLAGMYNDRHKNIEGERLAAIHAVGIDACATCARALRRMIEVRGLSKEYQLATGLRALAKGSHRKSLRALDDVSFTIGNGEVLGLVGESGSGKSTTGKLLVGLEDPTSGIVRIAGTDAAAQRKRDRREFHRQVQMVFQDPYGSLNPQHTIGEIVARPLAYQRVADRADIARRVVAVLEEVGLSPAENFLAKFPHQLSGGQRQRVCIARAIVLEPSFLVADEPISMLDVSIKWDIVRLLKRLVRDRGISLLYITHDLATVSIVCDRIAIMYLGRIVETGPVGHILRSPRHPYTRALLDAIPSADPDVMRPEPAILGSGGKVHGERSCGFAPRCPYADTRCHESPSESREPGPRSYTCHSPLPADAPKTGARTAEAHQ